MNCFVFNITGLIPYEAVKYIWKIECWTFYHCLDLQCHDTLDRRMMGVRLYYCNNMGENSQGRLGVWKEKSLCLWNSIMKIKIKKFINAFKRQKETSTTTTTTTTTQIYVKTSQCIQEQGKWAAAFWAPTVFPVPQLAFLLQKELYGISSC